MKKFTVVLVAAMCLAFGANAYAGVKYTPAPQHGHYAGQKNANKQVTAVQKHNPPKKMEKIVVVKQKHHPKKKHSKKEVVVVRQHGKNNAAVAIAAGILGVGLIAVALAN